MMARFSAFVFAIFLLATTPVFAANATIETITANGQARCLRTLGAANSTIEITGTWTGTLTFKGSINQNSTRFIVNAVAIGGTSVITATSANGVWAISNALTHVCVEATAAMTGTATVHIYSTEEGGGSSGGSVSVANGSRVDVDDDDVAASQTDVALTIGLPYTYNGTKWVRQGLGCAGRPLSAINFTAINLTADTQIITGTASQRVYVCHVHLVSSIANNVAVVQGTGSVCATGIAGVFGGTTAATGWNLGANSGVVLGGGKDVIAKTAADANNVCILRSSAAQVSGVIVWVSF